MCSEIDDGRSQSKASSSISDEYKMLKDETLKRIEARNQILSYTLAFAAAMFTLALGKEGYRSALLIYPLVSFFFAVAFAHNSLMLIEIGGYLRQLEARGGELGWATYLKPRYRHIEPFEVVATSGLFIGTQGVSLLLYGVPPVGHWKVFTVALLAVFFTIVSVAYPVIYHRMALRRG
jgi:hypothetical protein